MLINKFAEIQEYFIMLNEKIKEKNARKIFYFDVPLYPNIGDHLIARGTFSFLKRNNIKPAASINIELIDKFNPSPKDLIIFGGGGNFGDLYPHHNNARISFIKRNKHLRYIILPQTIHYSSKENLSHDKEVLNEVEDILLLARDNNSLSIAKSLCKSSFLFPDMAHCLYDEFKPFREKARKHSTLHFFRTDSEQSLQSRKNYNTHQSIDWPTFLRKDEIISLEKIHKYQKKLSKLHLIPLLSSPFFYQWQRASTPITNRTASFFSSFKTIHSDRLHALILGHLLDLQLIPIDNSYGKVYDYYKIWLQDPQSKRIQ